ncbi:MAG: MerR family transcriptional regulator [Bryobacterales bacterium]|nr:MerR family transcriptional regulator [Bryobacterales bacterium]
MTIGDLARRTATPASTIRYWEKAGVLPKPVRTSGQRRYGDDAIHRISVVRLAQACGFQLDETRRLLHGFEAAATPSRRWRELATEKRSEIDRHIARLQAMRRLVDWVLECRCGGLEECGRIASIVMGASARGPERLPGKV